MRTLRNDWMEAGVPDVRFFSVCTAGSSSGSVTGYAEYDLAGEDPPPSPWPVFIDEPVVDAAGRECAQSNTVMIVDGTGAVRYHQPTDLTNADQRKAFVDAVEGLAGPGK
jgi:hypothetical protein